MPIKITRKSQGHPQFIRLGEVPLEQYEYDALNRLTEDQDSQGALLRRWGYDAVGNRLSEETPVTGGGSGDDPGDQDEPSDPPPPGETTGGLVNYGYAADSHRLLHVGGVARTYDAAGNTTQIGDLTLIYNDANRLAEVRDGAATLATYTYNGQGQRVRKTASGSSSYFHYDEAGKLVFEFNTTGTYKHYLWLGDLLVGMATPAGVYAIETDHLGTPRVASNHYGATAWRWGMWDNAFGQQPAQAAPSDGDGPSLTLNLRFPGQTAGTPTTRRAVDPISQLVESGV